MSWLTRLFTAFCCCTLGLFSQNSPPAPQRLALLLGNSHYLHLPRLEDVANDLQLMKVSLENAGFSATIAADATQESIEGVIVPGFLAKVRPGDVCFFYFSGYGTQMQQDNYLLPVEFNPATQMDMSSTTSLTFIQQSLEQKKAGLKILVLEASRDDPHLMGQGVGLTSPDLDGRDFLFAFSAPPNHLAPDNSGSFTKYLAATIEEKRGLSLSAIFQDVRKAVAAASQDRQNIYFVQTVTEDFYFHEPVKPEPTAVTVPVPEPIVPNREPLPPPLAPPRVVGTIKKNKIDKEDYVWIPAGSFKMGCVPSDTRCRPEEKPQHPVKLTEGFWMGRNEVKTISYERYVAADKKNRKMPKYGPSWDEKWKVPDSTYPMTEVSAEEAQRYCEWAGGRLPSEAQWEYAARAGQEDKVYPFRGDEDSREQANFYGIAGNDHWELAAPVGSFDANRFELVDMAGNVWEWCLDKFSKDYFRDSPAIDPPGPIGTSLPHVVRGGSYYSDPKEHLRISFREGRPKAGNVVGFRCVLPDSPAAEAILQIR